jgi:hypothetical protein
MFQTRELMLQMRQMPKLQEHNGRHLSNKYGAENVSWAWPGNQGFVYGADTYGTLDSGQFFGRIAKEKAETVIGFINDHQCGLARLEQPENEYRVVVAINMPIQQHVILSVSGFMFCLGALFGVEYDGWGCPVARSTSGHN